MPTFVDKPFTQPFVAHIERTEGGAFYLKLPNGSAVRVPPQAAWHCHTAAKAESVPSAESLWFLADVLHDLSNGFEIKLAAERRGEAKALSDMLHRLRGA